MANRQNVLELNGSRYDVQTGRVLGPSSQAHDRGKTIDGFVRRGSRPNVSKNSAVSTKPKQKSVKRDNPTISHAVHSKITPSKTLMRHAVHKPEHAPAHHAQKKTPGLHSPSRLNRAKHVPKSSLISKFGHDIPKVNKKIEPLEVRQAPEEPSAIEPAPILLPQHNLTLSPFEAALRKANSHKSPKLKKTPRHHKVAKKLKISPKALNASAAVIAALIIGGVVAYRSVPGIAVNLAANRAGVNASLPGYNPAGFSLSGPIEYSKGLVSIKYKSNSDDRSFRLVQQKSDWNSQNLERNFVAKQGSTQTIEDRGRTIYVYGGNNATWVSGGTWYQIEGNSALNYDQLLNLASSL